MMVKFNARDNFEFSLFYSKLLESIERMLSLSMKHIYRHIELAAKVKQIYDSDYNRPIC